MLLSATPTVRIDLLSGHLPEQGLTVPLVPSGLPNRRLHQPFIRQLNPIQTCLGNGGAAVRQRFLLPLRSHLFLHAQHLDHIRPDPVGRAPGRWGLCEHILSHVHGDITRSTAIRDWSGHSLGFGWGGSGGYRSHTIAQRPL